MVCNGRTEQYESFTTQAPIAIDCFSACLVATRRAATTIFAAFETTLDIIPIPALSGESESFFLGAHRTVTWD